VFLFFSILIFLLALIYFCQRQERERLNALWNISFSHLTKSGKTFQNNVQNSTRSVVSAENSREEDTEHTIFFNLNNEIVVAYKHPYHGKWSSKDEEEFRKMRTLDHANLNRFLGVSISDNIVYFLWQYCDRGNLVVSSFV
jgi:hypothetical protein